MFRIAVTQGKATSTARLELLADFCVQELNLRGLQGVEKEAVVPGAGREKRWDVAWAYDGKYRLGVSLKSLLRNLGGAVPNRINDMIGEVTNAQLYSPEIVLGYIMAFNVADDEISPKHGSTWCDLFRERTASSMCRKRTSSSLRILYLRRVEDFLAEITAQVLRGPQVHLASTEQR